MAHCNFKRARAEGAREKKGPSSRCTWPLQTFPQVRMKGREGGGEEEGVSLPRINLDGRTCNLLAFRFAASPSRADSRPSQCQNDSRPLIKIGMGATAHFASCHQ